MVATQTIHLTGLITADGELKVDLPEGIAPGEVELTLKVTHAAPQTEEVDDLPLTDEELAELMKIEPKSGAEALAELAALDAVYGNPWANMGIMDSVEWVQEQRRKRREHLGW
ncbi:MAG: hypothetical protein H7Y09_13235 [Chitinophagaceae bacterium]|nr:hypothetical protein [Anaerolineae bacterium]